MNGDERGWPEIGRRTGDAVTPTIPVHLRPSSFIPVPFDPRSRHAMVNPSRLSPLVSMLAAMSWAAAASAMVSPTTLEELSRMSDVIVVGRDVRVFEVEGWRVAELEVERILDGVLDARTLYYLAEPTWGCDIATATPGERSLLFLRRDTARAGEAELFYQPDRAAPPIVAGSRPIYGIAHAGRGRMPIYDDSSGREFVTLVTADIELPTSLAAAAVPDSGVVSSLPLDAMESFVMELPPAAPPSTPTAKSRPLPAEVLRP